MVGRTLVLMCMVGFIRVHDTLNTPIGEVNADKQCGRDETKHLGATTNIEHHIYQLASALETIDTVPRIVWNSNSLEQERFDL
jgi:hypothetical protein